MTLDDWKKVREKTKVGAIKREEVPSLSLATPIPVPRAPRVMTIPGALRAPKYDDEQLGVLEFYC